MTLTCLCRLPVSWCAAARRAWQAANAASFPARTSSTYRINGARAARQRPQRRASIKAGTRASHQTGASPTAPVIATLCGVVVSLIGHARLQCHQRYGMGQVAAAAERVCVWRRQRSSRRRGVAALWRRRMAALAYQTMNGERRAADMAT